MQFFLFLNYREAGSKMFIKDYHKITSRRHNGIVFYHFHYSQSGNVDIYNESAEFYGCFMDINSFYKMYKKEERNEHQEKR